MNNTVNRPRHGGELRRAATEFGIPPDAWIDLSTGISPWSYPVPPLPEDIWRRLPEEEDSLAAIAAACYHCTPSQLLPVPGSQWAIAMIPQLLPTAAVALPRWGYREHAHHWRLAGHRGTAYNSAEELGRLVDSGTVDFAVVINPGNPSAEYVEPSLLQNLASKLVARDGFLLVDEAFMDQTPEQSLVPAMAPGLVVLRSVGKFFGLAGLRLGFAIGSEAFLERLAARLDPWAVSHPARWVGSKALADSSWQQRQRQRLATAGDAWQTTLAGLLPRWSWHSCQLFASAIAPAPQCRTLYEQCARRGLLIRVLESPEGPEQSFIRLGLPREEQAAAAARRLQLAWEACQ